MLNFSISLSVTVLKKIVIFSHTTSRLHLVGFTLARYFSATNCSMVFPKQRIITRKILDTLKMSDIYFVTHSVFLALQKSVEEI